MGGGREHFADVLRAMAALTVVCSHLIGVFWVSQVGVAHVIGQPEPLDVSKEWLRWATPIIENNLLLGGFGVAIFFIISGYVIPISLERYGRRQFLIKRALRIYPVYVAGLLFTVTAIAISAQAFGATFPFSIGEIIAQATILGRQWINSVRIDGVSWTLEIELYFYALMAVIGYRLVDRAPQLLSVLTVFGCVVVVLLFPDRPGWYIARQILSVCVMLLGTVLYLMARKRVSVKAGLVMLAINATMIVGTWLMVGHSSALGFEYGLGWIVAFVVFLAMYRFRGHVTLSNTSVVKHFADISYPLYVTHSIPGYCVMYSMIRLGADPTISLLAAVMVAYACAAIIHNLVEMPAMGWRRRDHSQQAI